MREFRNIEEKDWRELIEVNKSAFQDDHMEKENFLNFVKEEGFIGLFVDNTLVGYLLMRIMGDYGHLTHIAVSAKQQGKGYGTELMMYSIEFFNKHNVKKMGLYVETKNDVAINMYKKFGYKVSNETWHYWIKREQLEEIETKHLSDTSGHIIEVKEKDYDKIVRAFPDINKEELIVHLKSEKYKTLGYKIKGEIKVYARFNVNFSGCRPFLYINETRYVDEFIVKMKRYREKEYLRLTFDKYKELSEEFERRGYKLWHHLFNMEGIL